MKTEPNDAAFARTINRAANKTATDQKGLTKREYFAGLAMQGLLACNALYQGKENKELLSLDAVLHADNLIAQLNK